MDDETSLAFGHPEGRAMATAAGGLCDRISLRDHVVQADIGAFQSERGRPQRLRFNIVVEVRPPEAPLADDVDRILSYDRLTEAIAEELATGRVNLLETLAEHVAERILAEPRAMRAFVRVEKLDRGPGALGVEIVRARAAQPLRATAPEALGQALHPVVGYFDAQAIMADDLTAWIDTLASCGKPVVLTVGLPASEIPPDTMPSSPSVPAQRRIDLLAIEQMAWVLAGRDPRCLVVSSRTEIDWAMRHGQIVVWAPSKIVLDTPDSPRGAVRNPVALALWLAEQLAADRLVVHGPATPPAGSRVPVLNV